MSNYGCSDECNGEYQCNRYDDVVVYPGDRCNYDVLCGISDDKIQGAAT